MLKTGKNSSQISIFEFGFNEDLDKMRERSVKLLRVFHPSFFDSMLEFEDWPSAMTYLDTHRDDVFKFWESFDDRKD